MVTHPVLLYLGYVGLAVPFAFAMGALLSGRTDERWIVATRRWTLIAWTCLGFGQLLGAHWAYQEVGWGGYYAWDPVENAALMPWLAATAYLHSVMIQEKRGMLKVWNVVLVSMAFCLSLFGTFLTRSGIVTSIHSFTKSSIGPVVPRVDHHRGRRSRLTMIWLRLATAPRDGEARVARVPRGDLPLQQPAPDRALPHHSLGDGVADGVGGGAGRDDGRRRSLLQLLPPHLRTAAPAAHGHRPARCVAPRFAARPGADARVARQASPSAWASCSSRSAQAPRSPG